MTALLGATLAAVPVSCLVTILAVRRMLRRHREIIAALLTHRSAEVKDHVTSSADGVRTEAVKRLDILAEATGSLADATRALLMARSDPDGRKAGK